MIRSSSCPSLAAALPYFALLGGMVSLAVGTSFAKQMGLGQCSRKPARAAAGRAKK